MNTVSRLIFFGGILPIVLVLCGKPWYHAREARTANPKDFVCSTECQTTVDCPTGFSCFSATNDDKGCCLKALKPNETGCVIDDQCKRACESTHCDTSQSPSRCLCDAGRHFLFNKCWKRCPEFAHPDPVVDASGFSQCVLKIDAKAAGAYMRRFKRQMRSNFC
ncbi:hypothetical protein FO519_007350 [Halicephalobus sp. NKZ332]|nr:hypothetical protein FO519_007350 [Halicephalobus sp. NKZ332]